MTENPRGNPMYKYRKSSGKKKGDPFGSPYRHTESKYYSDDTIDIDWMITQIIIAMVMIDTTP